MFVFCMCLFLNSDYLMQLFLLGHSVCACYCQECNGEVILAAVVPICMQGSRPGMSQPVPSLDSLSLAPLKIFQWSDCRLIGRIKSFLLCDMV